MTKNFHTHVGALPTADIPDCKEAEKAICDLVGTSLPGWPYFDRAEAISTVLVGHFIDQLAESGRNHILTSNVEDAPTLLSIQRLEPLGCFAKKVSVNPQGFITAEDVKKYINARTGLVSLSWANALTGVIQPIASIAKVCQEAQVPLHVDVSHVAGKMQIRMDEIGIDYLTWDGMLFSKEPLMPIVSGRSIDPKWILQRGEKAQVLMDNLEHFAIESARIRDAFERKLTFGKALFQDSERLPGISCISFTKMTSELLAFHLKHAGFDVSFGGGAFQNIEHILKAAGIDDRLAKSALSFCLRPDSNTKELHLALEQIL